MPLNRSGALLLRGLSSKPTRSLVRRIARVADAYQDSPDTLEGMVALLEKRDSPIVRFLKARAESPKTFDRLLAALLDEPLRRVVLAVLRHPESVADLEVVMSVLPVKEKGAVLAALARDLATGSGRLAKETKLLFAAIRAASNNEKFHVVPDVYGHSHHRIHDIREEALFREAADEALRTGATLLYYDRLFHIHQSLENLSRGFADATLNVAEIGVYKGGTSFFICRLLERLHAGNARFWAIDTFEGHSHRDFAATREGAHVPRKFGATSHDGVVDLLRPFKFATVMKDRIQDCAHRLDGHRFHFVHLDVDIHAPTRFSLEFLLPRMERGGIICVDDYNKKSCPGVRQAVEEVAAAFPASFRHFNMQTGQCILVVV